MKEITSYYDSKLQVRFEKQIRMWGIFEIVWPRETGSVKRLIRTMFFDLSGTSTEAETGVKGWSENTRTTQVKEPASRRHEKANEWEGQNKEQEKQSTEFV